MKFSIAILLCVALACNVVKAATLEEDLPVCGTKPSDRCLSLQSTKSTWRNAFNACTNQGGELLHFNLPELNGSALTEYLRTVIPDEWGGVWTSGKTSERMWHWNASKYSMYLKDQGCYKRDVLSSDYLIQVSNDLNPDKCNTLCKEASYKFAAITFEDDPDVNEARVECFCSNTFHYVNPETGCDLKCPIQDSEELTFCGNEDRMLVYHLSVSGSEYHAWVPPGDRERDMCVAMDYVHEFKWVERSCHKKYGYICQYEVANERDCTARFKGGVCFSKHHDTLVNWWQAREECMKRSASLLVIRDSRIQEELEQFLKGSRENYWIGLTRWDWEWNTHENGYDLGPYINWKEMEPEDTFSKQCLALETPDLQWKNVECNDALSFICILNNYTHVETAETSTTDATMQVTNTTSTTITPAAGVATENIEISSSTTQRHNSTTTAASVRSTPSVMESTDDGEDDNNMLITGIAIGAALAVIVMIIVAALIFCVIRSKNNTKKPMYTPSAQEIQAQPQPTGYVNPAHAYDTPYEPRMYDLPPPPDYVEYDDAHKRDSGVYSTINENEQVKNDAYQSLDEATAPGAKQSYEQLEQKSMKKSLKESKIPDKDSKYEEVKTKPEAKYENINTQKDEEGNDRESTYDVNGYLVATPSMIKRAEEEKLKKKKIKEMGAKIDEENNDDEEDDDDNKKDKTKDTNEMMEYADVEGEPIKKPAKEADAKEEEKPYLRIIHESTMERESKL